MSGVEEAMDKATVIHRQCLPPMDKEGAMVACSHDGPWNVLRQTAQLSHCRVGALPCWALRTGDAVNGHP